MGKVGPANYQLPRKIVGYKIQLDLVYNSPLRTGFGQANVQSTLFSRVADPKFLLNPDLTL